MKSHYIFNRDIPSVDKYKLKFSNNYTGGYKYKNYHILWTNKSGSIFIYSTAACVTLDKNSDYKLITESYQKIRSELIRYIKKHSREE